MRTTLLRFLTTLAIAMGMLNLPAQQTLTLDLSKPVNPASFTFDPTGGQWTETYNDEDYTFIDFEHFSFSHLIDGEGASWDGSYWDGFTVSKSGDNANHGQGGTSEGWTAYQWGNMAGGGIKTDASGHVLKDENGKVQVDPGIPYLLAYCSAYSYEPACQIILTDADVPYKAVGVAEFTDGALHQSPDWEWIDLSSLGEVYGFYCTMISSDSDPMWGMNTATYFCMDKWQVEKSSSIPEYNYTVTVPKGASVFVGSKTVHYKPFIEKAAVYSATTDSKTTYYYNISGQHNYRVSKDGGLTHVGLFTPNATNTGLEITAEQLASRSPKEVDHDVKSLNGRNMADIFLNINAKGYLNLASGATHQLINLRNWQAIDSDVNNYFIEPDYHYTVVNENGAADNSVVTVSSTGLLTAVGTGKAIVLVTYDAMLCAHTTNVGNNGNAFFGALWPENTGVFVVSVDAPQSGITSNITINEDRNTDENNKMALSAVDAELDVFFYPEEKGGSDYTFKPEGVTSVTLAQPALGANSISYSGFSTSGVTANPDGSYTVRLTFGRNIVKLASASGGTEYQVFSAKPVTYTVSNTTNPGSSPVPGDEISILFNTLYHPCNKQSGVYNMTAGIQYTGADGDFGLILGPGQYTFASRAQEYKITIPTDYTGKEFTLTGGVIRVRGYGDHYGNHRNITLENGKAPNMNASVRDAYFGSLPDIAVQMKGMSIADISAGNLAVYPNPFAEFIIIEAKSDGKAAIYDISGKQVLTVNVKAGSNRIETSALGKGVYILKTGTNTVKIVK